MPLHKFQCNGCKCEFSELIELGGKTPDHCFRCGSKSIIKILSAPNFNVRGGTGAMKTSTTIIGKDEMETKNKPKRSIKTHEGWFDV